MKEKLLIVESPAKAKTIQKYLGKGYRVVSSMGHVRDLPETEFGVDIDRDFKPKFVMVKGKRELIKKLKELAKNRQVLLASDHDREGESIAWHLADILKLDISKPIRVVFNEITEKVIKEAVNSPRPIDLKKVDAQITRRILDRIVGYRLSPLLWEVVKKGLSAGRVQSVALKFICDRETQRIRFKPVKYHKIHILIDGTRIPLVRISGKTVKPEHTDTDEKLSKILEEVKQQKLVVKDVVKKKVRRKPPDPFITSTLQQESNTTLGWSAAKTMRIAQQLYEGVETPEGNIAFITYMRTDSTRISDVARKMASEYIEDHLGKDYVGGKTTRKRTKKNVQDAHEAIRPTYPNIDPEKAKNLIKGDHWKLYNLIWKRFMASQMAPSEYEEVRFILSTEDGVYEFESVAKTRLFDGFERVYGSSQEKLLSLKFEKGEEIEKVEIAAEAAQTSPPPRYTEASLVRELEAKGIGRPSTYATIINTLLDRSYVVRKGRELVPTIMGFLVNEFLITNFPDIINEKFTASMEEDLDKIENGESNKLKVISEFYRKFEDELKKVEARIKHGEISIRFETNLKCKECGTTMVLRVGRFGPYVECPKCHATKKISPESAVLDGSKVIITETEDDHIGEACPKCGAPLVLKRGKFGEFVACSAYPKCDYARNVRARGSCPKCGGTVEKRMSKKRKVYWMCSECGHMSWYEPSEYLCPSCGDRLYYRSSRGIERLYCEKERKYYNKGDVVEGDTG